jgi:single-stranded-DNA-specific exonuclease
VPLQGENRTLEHFGLTVLNKTRRVGLQRLIEIGGGTLGTLDITSIGFLIGPRINAAGRMTHASDALQLLLSEDEMEASMFAIQLQEINVARQKASQSMYLEAKQQVTDETKLIVVVGEGWSAGLVGLVAGKLVTDYGRPVYAVGKNDEHYVGSGRSVNGFDVTAALRHAGAYLDKFGGHPEACGFSVTGSEKFQTAVSYFHAFAEETISEEALLPTLKSDADVRLEEITWELFAQLDQCRPFGQGNPSPIFTSRRVKVQQMKGVGTSSQHLKLTLRSKDGKMMPAIGFQLGTYLDQLSLGQVIDIAYEIDVNEWNGSRELQLRLVDINL